MTQDYSDQWKRERLLRGEPLHFPANTLEVERTLSPEWIVEAVERSVPVDVDNALVSGVLNLRGRHISRPFDMVNSQLRGIDVSYASFTGSVRLTKSVCKGDANMYAARFEQDLWLDETRFSEETDLSYASVEVGLVADGAIFNKTLRARGIRVGRFISLEGAFFEAEAFFSSLAVDGSLFCKSATFGGQASFANVRVEAQAAFNKVRFREKAIFDGMSVGGPLYCQIAQFEGEASFKGVTVGGGASFKRASFRDKATFDGMTVAGVLFCVRACFEGRATFLGVSVGGQANFDKVIFKKNAAFDFMRITVTLNCLSTTFEGNARFLTVRVGSGAYFENAVFKKKAYFDSMKVTGTLFFERAIFEGEARFVGVRVGLKATFRHATFRSETSLEVMDVVSDLLCDYATYEHDASFLGVQVGGATTFRGATFRKSADFDGMEVRGGLVCDRATFEGKAKFRGVKVNGEARFVGARFKDSWLLNRAHLATFRVENELAEWPSRDPSRQFQRKASRVDLRELTYDQIFVYWHPFLDLQDPFDHQPYVQLERIMRNMGQDDEADSVFYRRRLRAGNRIWHRLKKRFRSRESLGDLVRGTGDLFLRVVAGYGVRPLRTLVWITLIPIITWLFFYSSPGSVHPKSAQSLPCAELGSVTWADAFWVTLQAYLPFELPVPLGLEPSDCFVRIPGTERVLLVRASDLAGWTRIIGWILVPVAVAQFTGLIRYVGTREK